jgi:hypothetical protein
MAAPVPTIPHTGCVGLCNDAGLILSSNGSQAHLTMPQEDPAHADAR